MPLRINDEAPNFTAETTEGTINFHDWIGEGWAVLFSHPKDFTPVCTTELGYMAGLKPEFEKRNCKVLGLSVDGVRNAPSFAGTAAVGGREAGIHDDSAVLPWERARVFEDACVFGWKAEHISEEFSGGESRRHGEHAGKGL